MLRVSAVKELPALSRMGEVGASDREGSSGEGRASRPPGSDPVSGKCEDGGHDGITNGSG